MNKLLIVAAAALFAVASFFATGAEAASFHLTAPKGVSNVHKTGCHGGRRTFRRHAIQSVRRIQKKKAYLARQEALAAKKRAIAAAKAKAAAQAKAKQLAQQQAEKPIETADAERENSSITTADGKVAAAPEKTEQKVAVAKELGCKQFFPSAGVTLTVPCE